MKFSRKHPAARVLNLAAALALIATVVVVGAKSSPVSEAAVPAGNTYQLQVTGKAGVASNASAVAINLAAVNPAGPGFITAYPCGSNRPTASTVNYGPGRATSNSSIVQIGTGGKICLYTLTTTDILVDVTGWFPANSDFTARAPSRLLDTRNSSRRSSGSTYELQVTGRAGVASNASAVAINLAAVNPAGPGFITAYPCGSNRPTASTVNYGPGRATSNSSIVQIGTGGKICLYTLTTTDILVDVTGWFPANSDFTARAPSRLLDTRNSSRRSSGSTYELQVTGRAGVASNASAVAINLAAVNPAGPGFITAYPCGSNRPTASTVNYGPGGATSNSSIVQIGTGGKICLYTLTTTDILVDVTGWFPANSDFTARAPSRLLDTRNGAPVPPGEVVFTETFDNNTGLDRLDTHVFHRNVDLFDYDGFSGGSWTGDHDTACGTPDTQRPLRFNANDSQATRRANSFYTCRNHMMTSMGDVENYSIVAFGPKQVFEEVSAIQVDVNLTDLGTRQWLKFGVLSTSDCPALNRSCMYSDVGAADLPGDLATSGRFIASWSGGLSGGYPGGLKIGNTMANRAFNAGSDKATRWPVALIDNGNGTVTFSVANQAATVSGSFPACPCRVVFYDHNYTPDKQDPASNGPPIGHTFHWDNVIVRE